MCLFSELRTARCLLDILPLEICYFDLTVCIYFDLHWRCHDDYEDLETEAICQRVFVIFGALGEENCCMRYPCLLASSDDQDVWGGCLFYIGVL